MIQPPYYTTHTLKLTKSQIWIFMISEFVWIFCFVFLLLVMISKNPVMQQVFHGPNFFCKIIFSKINFL